MHNLCKLPSIISTSGQKVTAGEDFSRDPIGHATIAFFASSLKLPSEAAVQPPFDLGTVQSGTFVHGRGPTGHEQWSTAAVLSFSNLAPLHGQYRVSKTRWRAVFSSNKPCRSVYFINRIDRPKVAESD